MRSMWWPRIAAALVALSLWVVTGLAAADMTPQEQFLEGQKLFDDKQYEEALPFFKNAFERSESPNARLYVARCLEKLGRLPEAYSEMKATEELSSEKAKSDTKYKATAKAAAAELAALKARVGLLTIEVPAGVDATVYIGERELAASEIGTPLVLTPGTIEIRATTTSGQTKKKSIELSAGEDRKVALDLDGTIGTVEPQEPISEDESEPLFPLAPLRVAGIGVAGLGVVGVVVFAVTGSMASSKYSQLEEECGAARCVGPQYEDVIDEGKTLSTVANVSITIGAAAIVGGALMILFGGPAEGEEAGLRPTRDGVLLRF
jgi:hypothetical protein